ncbi:MAG: glycoside hydrolase family 47 protein [Calditrichaeota bacterium]|nr:MAG: glycoside hydrolase family 47 protein [Calditrichota bacterium]
MKSESNHMQKHKAQLAAQVKQEFLHAWNGYKQYAWGHDALKPLSRGYHDWYRVSFCMTPVDAFDTLLLMGLGQEAGQAKQLIFERLSFDHDIEVQTFEITIRLLGGLLSAYQLDGDERFLRLAQNLADRLLPAFQSPTGMPYRMVNLKTGKTSGAVSNPAEIGTLMIEFGTLAKLTQNTVYYQKAKKAIRQLFRRRSEIGLMGTTLNVETGEWINKDSHISGMIDSYYEYLLKSWRLFGDGDFKHMWQASIKAVNTYLADETDSGLWYGHADMNTGRRTQTHFGALDAYFPAVLALTGDLPRAKKLQDSCFKMWTLHGIEPEMLDYSNMQVVNPAYYLRPENIESAYYLYHFTGDEKYLQMGETYLNSLKRYCKTDVGYAMLGNVLDKTQKDSMESFFLAETLKYLYLLFAPPETLDFNQVIFNTEAHPIRPTWR